MPLLSSFSLGGPTGFGSGGSAPLQEFTKAYTYTGGIQTFAAPAETDSIQAFVWGAGASGRNQNGGAGGFTTATINSANNTTFKIVVGQGSTRGRQQNGVGAGYSGVFTNAWGSGYGSDQNAAILMAGAGGGGSSSNGPGGAGGGNSGQGGTPGGGQGGGGGQSQTNNYGGQAGGNCTAPQGHCHGRAMRGGTGCGGGENSVGGDRTNWPCVVYGGGTWCSAAGGNGCNGAGGGSGYYGGGGGGSNPNSSPGGGGSGYIGGHPNHPVTSANTYQGNYKNIHPAANSSPHYTPGIGNGGRSNGQNGRVVIVYEAYEAVP